MLEVINQQYITTARAKGLSETRVVLVHALRNSLVPLVTLMASLLPGLIGGSVIVESIFSMPGIGRLGFEAILSRDIPVIMAIASISALLTLVGILLSDIMYAVVDPRIRLEGKV
jgi:peptide/nickel transport system permease protein